MADLDTKQVLNHLLTDKGTIVINTGEFSSLPKTISNSNILEDFVCVKEVLTNPSAQTADWRVTTSNGSVKIDADYDSPTSAQRTAAISGTTDVTLYLNPTTSGGKACTTVINVSSFSSLPKTVTDSSILSKHMVARSILSNPSAQTADWAITTIDGQLTIDVNSDSPSGSERAAAISGSTTAELYLTVDAGDFESFVPNLSINPTYHGSWEKYDGEIYRSVSSHNVANAWDTTKITFSGCTWLTLKIRSYAESTYDYVLVSQLNNDYLANCTSTSSMRSAYSNTTYTKAYTRGKQSATNWESVTFDGLDPSQEYYFYVIYQKDSSADSNDDRGYFYVESYGA